MGNKVVEGVMKDAVNRAYRTEYEYCRRAVCTLMAVSGESGILLEKEVAVLSVMCKMSIQGKDYTKNKLVMKELQECGVEEICHGTMRNYRTKLKNKGWLVGRQLNMLLRKAISNKGISVGIFHYEKT